MKSTAKNNVCKRHYQQWQPGRHIIEIPTSPTTLTGTVSTQV